MQFEKMITEGSNTASAEIDRVSTLEMCRIINDEDKTVPLAVERVLPDIAAALPDVRVLTNEDLGFDGDAKEAVAFAVLANEAIFAQCSSAPGATGARHGAVLGKITL